MSVHAPFDFDRVIERRGTHASKWDNIAKLSGITAADAIPMWVADMDFAAPPGVTAALHGRSRSGQRTAIMPIPAAGREALCAWMAKRHGLTVDPAWVSPTPGIVSGLGLILQAVTRARRRSGGVPARLPRLPPHHHGQRPQDPRRASWSRANGRYAMDLDALRAQAHAAHEDRVLLQPAQSRRHGLVARARSRRWPTSAPSAT